MSQEVSETFMVWGPDGDFQYFAESADAKKEARDLLMGGFGYDRTRVYHLDFTTNKMTLIKEYRRRTESDEEGIVEYV